jgi:hypothetical protein
MLERSRTDPLHRHKRLQLPRKEKRVTVNAEQVTARQRPKNKHA